MESSDNAIKNWANKFPFGFKEFTKGMSNENRIAIAGLLMEKEELRFTEIKETLNLPKNLLSQHLKILLKYGIIRRAKSYWTVEEKVFKSKYKLNPIYRNLIKTTINQLSYPIIKYSDKLIKTAITPREELEVVSVTLGWERPIISYITEERTNKKIPVTFSGPKDWLASEIIKGGDKKWKNLIRK